MSSNLGNVYPVGPLGYLGTTALNYVRQPFAPNSGNYQFTVPTLWVDSSTKGAYLLTSVAANVANWLFLGSGGGDLATITTPDSVVVIPVLDNINFLNGTGMNITGSGNNITFTATGDSNWVSGSTRTVGAVTSTLASITTASNTTTTVFGRVAAWNTANTAAFGGDITAIGKNVAGTLTVIGPPDAFNDADSALSTASYTITTSGTSLILQVTGVTGLTIDWTGGFNYSVAS